MRCGRMVDDSCAVQVVDTFRRQRQAEAMREKDKQDDLAAAMARSVH